MPDSSWHAYDLTTTHNFIYFSGSDSKIVHRVNITTPNKVRSVTTKNLSEQPYGIQIYNKSKQPNSKNYCSIYNKYCSNICLPSADGKDEITNCHCPKYNQLTGGNVPGYGFHLLGNGLTCIREGRCLFSLIAINLHNTCSLNFSILEFSN